MKTLKMILLVMIASLFAGVLPAQVSVGINIGAPRYYYLPGIEAYYDRHASMYIYLSGSRWIHTRALPESYGHYDIDHGHKVIINDYRGNRPYVYYNEHRTQFRKGHYGDGGNNSWSAREYKQRGNKNKPQGKEFRNEQNGRQKDNGNRGNGRGNGKGNGRGKNK